MSTSCNKQSETQIDSLIQGGEWQVLLDEVMEVNQYAKQRGTLGEAKVIDSQAVG